MPSGSFEELRTTNYELQKRQREREERGQMVAPIPYPYPRTLSTLQYVTHYHNHYPQRTTYYCNSIIADAEKLVARVPRTELL